MNIKCEEEHFVPKVAESPRRETLRGRNRLDWGMTYFRHVEKINYRPDTNWVTNTGYYIPSNIKQKTHYGELQLNYPFTRRSAVGLTIGLRYDQQVFLATDTMSLHYPDTSQLWTLARLAYHLDRTKQAIEYICTGFKTTFFVEYQYQLKSIQTGFVHIGFDSRHYLPVYKNIVWANKLSGAWSGGGTNGMMYVLGGISNWLAPQVDTSVHFTPTDNYSFITYANNLRGYRQNIRTGNIYLLFNSELRIPVLHTFNAGTTRMKSLNHLQVVPFIDIGNAWKASNKTSIPQWAIGYGAGLRTTLLSYYVRLDVAWQTIHQSNQKRPMVMIGMGRAY
jgi:hypothetical protein